MLMHYGITRNTQMDGVIQGKFSALVPSKDGKLPSEAAQDEVTLIMLGARSNHPLGIFAPGYADLEDYMNRMLTQLAENANEYGYLGYSNWLENNARTNNNQVMIACYFRTIEDLHAYAHSPLHREAWNWWNSLTKSRPYLAINHEVYQSPKKHWENIYINCHPSGINAMVRTEEGWTRPIVDARRGGMRSQTGRMSRSAGDDNEKYGPEPY
ncbi:hypothetical protein PHISCL_04208 [Aspergillus sclerotialis]|uniref:Uncharacterized protein n=1 Tax=Aspergillus sclerotialis TaxID=2070753 RepID=A0A3A2ZLK2_9EURO|nr:hypothetical protein PHISCL_04208 [Aspergillus sclerotialis]